MRTLLMHTYEAKEGRERSSRSVWDDLETITSKEYRKHISGFQRRRRRKTGKLVRNQVFEI